MNNIKNKLQDYKLFRDKSLPAFKILLYFLFFYLTLMFLNLSITYTWVIVFICLFSVFIFYKFKHKYLSFVFLTIILGSVTFIRFKQGNFIEELPYVNKQEVFLNGRVSKILYENERFSRLLVECNIISKDFIVEKSKLILNLVKHSKGERFYIQPKVGNTFISQAYLSTNKDKVFIEEFPSKLYANSFNANFSALCFTEQFTITNQQPTYYLYLDKIRNEIENKIIYLFPKDVAKLVLALTIGQKNLMTAEDNERFALTGTSHVIAVSGLHVAVIASFLYFITIGIRNLKLKTIINVGLIISYLILTGLQDSAIRSGIMAILILISLDLKRYYDIRNILCVTILLFILYEPNVIFSISFQLSILALVGIVFYYSRVEERINKYFPYTRNIIFISFITTISATFLLNPVVAYYFQNFSISSIVANLYAIPLTSLVLVASIPIIGLSFILPKLMLIIAKSITLLVRLLYSLNDFVLSYDSFYFKGNETIVLAVAFMFVVLLFIYIKNYKQMILYSLLVVCILYCLNISINYNVFRRENFEYEFELIQKKHKNYLIVFDYNPKSKPELDYDLYKFLLKDKNRLNLYFNGNNGQYLFDKLKNDINIDTFKIKERILF